MRAALAVVALGAMATAIASLSLGYGDASAEDQSVEVGNLYFCGPSFQGQVCETSINAGDTVTWNVASGFHTVTQCSGNFTQCPSPGGFDSGQLSEGGTFSQTFNTQGAYEYRCNFHPVDMRGRILVAAQPTVSPTAAPTATGAGSTATAGPQGTTALTAVPAAVPLTGGTPAAGADEGSFALLAAGVLLLLAAGGLGFATVRRR